MDTEKDILDNVDIVNEPPILNYKELEEQGIIEKDDRPQMTDKEWTPYVLKQLEEDEIYDGKPTTDGLRRLVSKLLGEIVESVPIVHQSPNPANDNHAVVSWKLCIRWNDCLGDVRIFGDVADVYIGNTDDKFAVFASATAATRAEGRALKKALQLQHVLTMDEVTEVPVENPTKITSAQVRWVNMACERNDINVIKLLGMSQVGKELKTIEDMNYATAVKMIQYINECQSGKKAISDKVKGYDPNWRK